MIAASHYIYQVPITGVAKRESFHQSRDAVHQVWAHVEARGRTGKARGSGQSSQAGEACSSRHPSALLPCQSYMIALSHDIPGAYYRSCKETSLRNKHGVRVAGCERM